MGMGVCPTKDYIPDDFFSIICRISTYHHPEKAIKLDRMNTNSPEEQRNQENHLRQRAEEALHGKPVDLDGLPTEDIQYLLHELQVYQAELSLQNEELRRFQLDLEVSRDLYSDLYNLAPVGYCTLSQKGRILNANQTLAELLEVDQEKLLHRPLSDFVDRVDQDEFYLHCQRAFKNHQREESEIRLHNQTRERITVRIESVIARGDPTRLMVMLSDITGQRQLEAKEQEYAAQVKLQGLLIEQSEKERGDLARNLHDGPLQSLAGLGFSLQIIKQKVKAGGGDGYEDIEQMVNDIKNLSAELRGICNDLRPPVLTRFGLHLAIQANTEEFQTKHPHIKITLVFPEDPTVLPEPITLALYRIYQQALSNIIRHAKASEVCVRIKFDPKQILLEIQDNGQGFLRLDDWTEYARRGHLGVIGMKERAEAVGGTMQLLSKPDEGTIVQVTVPLGADHR
jgi:PAS domain S-box-containing protein